MILAIIPQDEVEPVLRALVAAGHTATYADGRGGMLRQAQQMLFIVVAESDLEPALRLIKDHCRTRIQAEAGQAEARPPNDPAPVTAKLGGAIVFVWDLVHCDSY